MKASGTPPVFANTPAALFVKDLTAPEVLEIAKARIAPRTPASSAEKSESLNDEMKASR